MRPINNSIKINVAYFEEKNLNVLQIDSNLLYACVMVHKMTSNSNSHC